MPCSYSCRCNRWSSTPSLLGSMARSCKRCSLIHTSDDYKPDDTQESSSKQDARKDPAFAKRDRGTFLRTSPRHGPGVRKKCKLRQLHLAKPQSDLFFVTVSCSSPWHSLYLTTSSIGLACLSSGNLFRTTTFSK